MFLLRLLPLRWLGFKSDPERLGGEHGCDGEDMGGDVCGVAGSLLLLSSVCSGLEDILVSQDAPQVRFQSLAKNGLSMPLAVRARL